MGKQARRKPVTLKQAKSKLGLPDLDHSRAAVLDSLLSPESKRGYRRFWQTPDPNTLKGKRDRAMLAVLLGCGLRRRELADLDFRHLQQREDHWAIVDLVGKGGHIRTVPVPEWVKTTVDEWIRAAELTAGRRFRCVCRAGKWWGDGVTERVVWHVVKFYAARVGFARLAPHDLRRSCAKLCHSAGGELEQIQFLLGHVSVQTTERYLGWNASPTTRQSGSI